MEIMASTSNAENLEKIAKISISYVTTHTLEFLQIRSHLAATFFIKVLRDST